MIDWQETPQGSGLITHALIATDTGSTIYQSSNAFDYTTSSLPPGNYRFQTSVFAGSSDYTGSYNLALRIKIAPQNFPVALPVTISNGSPGAGAGNLETADSSDTYSFTVPAGGGRLVEDWVRGPGNQDMVRSELINTADGSIVASWPYAYDTTFAQIPQGSYQLVISPYDSGTNKTGTYQLNLALDTGPQTFPVTLPATISTNAPSTGAGHLETIAAVDNYTFTIPAGPNQKVSIEWGATPQGSSLINHALISVDTSSTIYQSSNAFDHITSSLPPGNYRLQTSVFAGSADYTGTYRLLLSLAP